ncbi:hypothetical protein, variant 1 [Aphanomyces astaci]|uniref:Tyrosine-protein kinase ephrin type A/B receptor-like domain-containing protein n=1 Tax=Aphanomyces astaci TaxID=112090 RepID=W4GC41_APHAT|nr:hypothetical protein, variant 1 [Aphanomyces astaci]ETV76523.1 hypothetical protein, variant 1 [Aphanomyces astaci]|eukprot:XP_009834069.1 hypothetical protein, variant 1 [Aphanomyces astaci]
MTMCHDWKQVAVASIVLVMVEAGIMCPRGSFWDGSACTLCPAGMFGATRGLISPLCSGPCSGGYFCPVGSTSPVQQQCGSPNYYCPPGTPLRRTVATGYFTVKSTDGNGLDDFLMSEPYTSSAQVQCEVGHYCISGIQYQCPPGTFGQTRGLISKQCSGLCPPGTYCPLASPTPVPCPPGFYGATSGLQTSLCSGVCPKANYCLLSTVTPEPCPAGLFGNSTGLVSKQCSTTCTAASCIPPYCRAGYYCPLGTLTPLECGGIEVYCPEGSSIPTTVSPGYYTISTPTLNTVDGPTYITGQTQALTAATIRVNQQICERGMYCTQGQKRKCSSGTYGATEGLTTALCTGTCPVGYYCPEGSSDYSHFACLDPSVFCPPGSSTPVLVSSGYFSLLGVDGRLRIGQQICPAGSYCVRGVAHLCPLGTPQFDNVFWTLRPWIRVPTGFNI